MEKENLDNINKEILADVKEQERLERLLKHSENKPIFSFLKKKKKDPKMEKKPLADIKIPSPESPSNNLEHLGEELPKPESIFGEEKLKPVISEKDTNPKISKESNQVLSEKPKQLFSEKPKKRRLLGRIFRKKENQKLQPLEPIKLKDDSTIKDEDFMPKPSVGNESPKLKEENIEKKIVEKDNIVKKEEETENSNKIINDVLKTEKKLNEENLIKTDFSLKELPEPSAGEKEVKEPAEPLAKAKLEIDRLNAKLKEPSMTNNKIKRKSKKQEKKQQSKSTTKVSDNKTKNKKTKKKPEKIKNSSKKEVCPIKDKDKKENKYATKNSKRLSSVKEDKKISREAKIKRIGSLKKNLDKKESQLKKKKKYLDEKSDKYSSLINEIKSLKKYLASQKQELEKKEKDLEKKEKDLEKKEKDLEKKEKEIDIDDRALDFAMAEFEKEKMKLEDDEFHAYLNNKISQIHGMPVSDKISINDIKKAESLRVPDMSDRKLTMEESIQKCKELISQRKFEQAKFIYNSLRLEFMNKQLSEPKRTKLYNDIRELYDSINIASLNKSD